MSKDDAPFLIVHGDQDPMVPYDQSVRFYKALKEAGVEAYFITIKGGGHGGFRNNSELRTRTKLFIEMHLLDRPATIDETDITIVPNA